MQIKFLAFGVACFVAFGIWQASGGPATRANQAGGSDSAALLEHGEYLVTKVAMCADCHTPHDDNGKPDQTKLLRGATIPIRPKKEMKNWADESPDITGGGLAGKLSEEQIVKFLTTGLDPKGEKASPPMPAFRLNAKDARAVAAYLKSLRHK